MPAGSGIRAGTPSVIVESAVILVERIIARRLFPPFGAASGMLTAVLNPSLALACEIMSSSDEGCNSNAGEAPSPGQAARVSKEEARATLLLRLLGVYFIAEAIISGWGEVIRSFVAMRTVGFNEAWSAHGLLIAHFVATLAIGIYFFRGGRWVVERVLLPAFHSSSESASED